MPSFEVLDIEDEDSAGNTRINLTASYFIEWDGRYNWTLKRAVTRKARQTGEEYEGEDVLGYYGDIGALLRRLIEENIRVKGTTTIAELHREVTKSREETTAIGDRIWALVKSRG